MTKGDKVYHRIHGYGIVLDEVDDGIVHVHFSDGSIKPVFDNQLSIELPVEDSVDHPKYYNQGKIEVIDFIEDKHLGFNLGNCVKYISRCYLKHKDNPVEDLKKARWYLDREIQRIERESTENQ